jgi:hypothetical protein
VKISTIQDKIEIFLNPNLSHSNEQRVKNPQCPKNLKIHEIPEKKKSVKTP